MRKIDEKEFVSYTVSNGWSLTVFTLKDALKHFNDLSAGTLYGNKPDGTRAILDSK